MLSPTEQSTASVFPFPQQDKILLLLSSHEEETYTEELDWQTSISLSSVLLLFLCSQILLLSSWSAGSPKPLFFPATHPLTAVINTSPPSSHSSLLLSSKSVPHKHLHVKLFLFKKHFTSLLKFLLNSDLFLFNPQSNKQRPFDADYRKKFTWPRLHANVKCLSVVSLPHIGNCITLFLGQQPSA